MKCRATPTEKSSSRKLIVDTREELAAVAADSQEALRALGAQVAGKIGPGVVILGAQLGDKAAVVAFCSPEAVQAGHQAGKLVQAISLQLGGRGGGKPDFAMGGGRDTAKLAAALAAV